MFSTMTQGLSPPAECEQFSQPLAWISLPHLSPESPNSDLRMAELSHACCQLVGSRVQPPRMLGFPQTARVDRVAWLPPAP